jgi:hypothetical protein
MQCSPLFLWNMSKNKPSKKPAWSEFVPEDRETCSSQTWVDFLRTTQWYITEDRILQGVDVFFFTLQKWSLVEDTCNCVQDQYSETSMLIQVDTWYVCLYFVVIDSIYRYLMCFLYLKRPHIFFFLKDPIYLQSVIIHSANGGKGEGWLIEEYSVALLC